MSDQSIIRITKELSDIQKSSDLSLAVACRDADVRNVDAMIIGPPDTPYEFGFFEFIMKFPRDYPRKSPSVTCVTTNSGRCRFNPNIYANGKVCLSILGTWRGERGEEWSAAQGLESILLSIQSLMSSNPYENEPGYESANEPQDKVNQKHYRQKIRHETLRVSVIQRLEEYLAPLLTGPNSQRPPIVTCNALGDVEMDGTDDLSVPFEPFKELCKQRFRWYYASYANAIQQGKSEVKDGQAFERMPFEGSTNIMDGRFNYSDLEKRLEAIKAALEAETTQWAVEGKAAYAKDATVAVNLRRQFEQSVESFKRTGIPHNIELEDNNPFVWTVTYFGKPMTNLDGGLFRFRVMLSPRFPEEQPRVRFETHIFHHHISPDGTPCYSVPPTKREDLRAHIEAIIDVLEEENPPYDPRTLVNPEAHKLLWGTPEERKVYNRRLRRSVQMSVEACLLVEGHTPIAAPQSSVETGLSKQDVGRSPESRLLQVLQHMTMSPQNIASGPGPASWKEASVYQIYPASFKDSTGSGTGDLQGIISKVDYLHELGVDIVWLSPIFESPQVDMGYDISNYLLVDPQYGSIADVDELKERLHERGMKLVLDLVVNHTSDQHEWFQQARSAVDNPFRDWYIWKKPRYDSDGVRQPPNNWQSHFQGSAWQYDEATDEYYLHLFCREQPDLNWEKPAVRRAVHDTMRFWLDRGIDGFRLDVINFISKDPAFPNSDRRVLAGSEFYAAGPRLHEYLRELGAILQEYGAFSVGEMPCVSDPQEIIKSVAASRGELNMIFHFELMDLDHGPAGKFSARTWTLAELKTIVAKWQHFMYDNDGWNALYLENHDQPRSVSRFASDDPALRGPSAKMLAVFLGFQAGTPFVYQGQELGMHNVPADWGMEEYKDVDCLNHWAALQAQEGAEPDDAARAAARREYAKKSRDNARTPMQWDASPHAGFTAAGGAAPWMRVHPNHTVINAAAEQADPGSAFHCWRRVLATRKQYKDILVYGRFALVGEADDSSVFAYSRTSTAGRVVLVTCNFAPKTVTWPWPPQVGAPEVLVSTVGRSAESLLVGTGAEIELSAYEGLAVLLGA